jgi:hypothetical protein
MSEQYYVQCFNNGKPFGYRRPLGPRAGLLTSGSLDVNVGGQCAVCDSPFPMSREEAERIVNNMPLVNGSGRVAMLFPQS